jgi:hypothetical protein
MKLWIDDVRPAPEGYLSFKTVNDTLRYIRLHSEFIDVIDLDHDAGDCSVEGGDYIEILNELERLSHRPTSEGYYWDGWLKNQVVFRIHSANPVGVQNMRRIIERNGWKEVL